MNEKEKKVLKLFQNSEQKEKQSANVSIQGDGNIYGNNNTIHNTIKTERVLNRPVYLLKQGDEHIAESEAKILYDLVHKIYEVEQHTKQKPRTIAAIWKKLNDYTGVTTYKATPKNMFEKAEKYLRQALGRLNSAPSAKKKNPNWREQRYKAIHTNTRMYNNIDKMRLYISKNFSATSLTELNDENLEITYRYVMGLKKNTKAKT